MRKSTYLQGAMLAASLLGGLGTTARAQGPGGFGGPGGGMMNMTQGPMGEVITKLRQSRALADPGTNAVTNLLTRSDVRTELALNSRQVEALADYQNGFGTAMRDQIMQNMQQMRADFNGVNPNEMSNEERQEYFEQMRAKMQETVSTVQSEQGSKAQAALKLTPAQTKRLRELDLQWRGPLALTDAKVNLSFNLTPDQTTKLTALYKEFRARQQTAQGSMFGGRGGAGMGGGFGRAGGPPPGGGAQPGNPGVGDGADNAQQGDPNAEPPVVQRQQRPRFAMPSPEELQTKLDDANKTLTKQRAVVDAKALALLTPEQQQQWKTLTGRPYAFRTSL